MTMKKSKILLLQNGLILLLTVLRSGSRVSMAVVKVNVVLKLVLVVVAIVKTISPTKFDINAIFNHCLVRNEWLSKIDKIRQPGTIRNYLNSLKQFYEFILCDKPDGVDTEDCHAMMARVSNWSSSYKDRVKKRKFEKQVEDIGKLLAPEELQEFDSSEVVHESQLAIKKALHTTVPPVAKTYILTRDYIISTLILSNASRPGAIRNMKLSQFRSATIDENGLYIVLVTDHKTAATSGPTAIVFTSQLYHECRIFIQKIRNMLVGVTKSGESCVFLSWNGNTMSSALIGDQFSSFFQKATTCNLEERRKRKMTTTLVRKSFVSKVHGEKPELKKDLSNMMCHSENTARASYFLEEKKKNVSKTFQEVQQTMLNDSKSDVDSFLKDLFEEELMGDEKITLMTVRNKADRFIELSLSDLQVRDKLRYLKATMKLVCSSNSTDVNENENGNTDELTGEYVPPSDSGTESEVEEGRVKRKRTVFAKEEERLIKNHFAKIIENPSVLVKNKSVKRVLDKTDELADFRKRFHFDSIVTKVRTEKSKYNKKYRKEPEDI